MTDSIKIDTHEVLAIANRIGRIELIRGDFVARNMQALGRRLAYLMRQTVSDHKYTGALEEGIVSEFDAAAMRLEVGSTAKRGRWDAGEILERGTGPIPNLPFAVIKRWAEFKGLPAGPVWYKIKTEGVSAHPWIQRFIDRGDTQTAIQHTADRIGLDIVAHIASDNPSPAPEV